MQDPKGSTGYSTHPNMLGVEVLLGSSNAELIILSGANGPEWYMIGLHGRITAAASCRGTCRAYCGTVFRPARPSFYISVMTCHVARESFANHCTHASRRWHSKEGAGLIISTVRT